MITFTQKIKKMKKSIISILFICLVSNGWTQIGIGTTNPNTSAALDVTSTTKGFLPPRMTNLQIVSIASPAEGLFAYCTDCSTKGIYVYNGTNFTHLPSGTTMKNSSAVLTQIGLEGDNPDSVNSVVTYVELGLITPPLTGLVSGNITLYQDYIDANPDSFSSPATQAEVQAMVTAVNASQTVLVQIGLEGDNPDSVNSVVTTAQLALITPAITGIDNGNETAYQDHIDANPDNFSSPATRSEVQTMVNTVNATGPPTVTGSGGATWLDRNLGATQVATSSTDTNAYGDLYQWGRNTDGHEIRTSNTASGPVSIGNEGVNFITNSTFPTDWVNPQDGTRWNGATKGTHDPCPSGYRVPTSAEWSTEKNAWASANAAGGFASPLKLPVTGYRSGATGTLTDAGVRGLYWSSTLNANGYQSNFLNLKDVEAPISGSDRSNGLAIRCIQE